MQEDSGRGSPFLSWMASFSESVSGVGGSESGSAGSSSWSDSGSASGSGSASESGSGSAHDSWEEADSVSYYSYLEYGGGAAGGPAAVVLAWAVWAGLVGLLCWSLWFQLKAKPALWAAGRRGWSADSGYVSSMRFEKKPTLVYENRRGCHTNRGFVWHLLRTRCHAAAVAAGPRGDPFDASQHGIIWLASLLVALQAVVGLADPAALCSRLCQRQCSAATGLCTDPSEESGCPYESEFSAGLAGTAAAFLAAAASGGLTVLFEWLRRPFLRQLLPRHEEWLAARLAKHCLAKMDCLNVASDRFWMAARRCLKRVYVLLCRRANKQVYAMARKGFSGRCVFACARARFCGQLPRRSSRSI